MKKLVSSILFAAATMTVTAATPLWLRDVQISPDGKTIAFTYKGDIFTVPALLNHTNLFRYGHPTESQLHLQATETEDRTYT